MGAVHDNVADEEVTAVFKRAVGAAGTSAAVESVNTDDVAPWPKLVIADIRNLYDFARVSRVTLNESEFDGVWEIDVQVVPPLPDTSTL